MKKRVKGFPPSHKMHKKPAQLTRMDDLYIPVPESGCWIWLGLTDDFGYGFCCGVRAHRYFYIRHNGPLAKGMGVFHKCDTPSCVNPDHLFAGEQQENVKDMCKKGRQAKGRRHKSSPESRQRRDKVKELLRSGVHPRQVALEAGVSMWVVAPIRAAVRKQDLVES